MPTSTNPKVGSEWFTSIKDIQEKVINVVFGEKKKKHRQYNKDRTLTCSKNIHEIGYLNC